MENFTTTPKAGSRFSGRRTNLALLALLTSAFATGLTAQAIGTPAWGNVVVILHGVVGLSVLLLAPWKTKVAQRGLARRNAKRFLSLVLAGLATIVLVTGIVHSTGTVRHIGPFTVLWVHVATALLLIPLIVWHYVARKTSPRSTDLTRRSLLRLGGLTSLAGALWLGADRSIALTQLPGSNRRFSGSHERSSFVPAGIPVTSWLDDRTPTLDSSSWRLTIEQGSNSRQMSLAELTSMVTNDIEADLDCTSGWYTRQVWNGVRLDKVLVPNSIDESVRSIGVWSATGYARRFPVDDLERLWLVTGVGGEPLSAGHGFPARLMAPDRRGFWWVKWVVRIETSPIPWWIQLPYPAT
ncbi:MAG TPA: molybdopterin-dependent oxidoreductase [Acidimicrobiia bacterium]|nr:molybdopterin-dependent oxidoreductase [Acidimicrobiia bacterium]